MEEFFDLQREQFFKTRLRTMIRSIIRNKIRKERLVVVVAFHRFIKNCSLMRTDTITLPTAISKTNVLKECRPSIIYNTQSECANNQSAKLNSRKSDYNSRTTLVCDSNKTSQIRDKSMTRIK
jgi:CRISPR/Cas system CMR-associated protein Cmr3 (group 5 of RAMP superfamily)